ncbi:MAG: hypothetical protein RLO51_06665 [Thalassobaculum sp.]|uniref:hypothetical protein n=1 Tax=Thalassobaculum sp. TaxID=2022740 RepID=UPI0032EB7290
MDYIWVGAAERRDPTPAFDEAYYLAANPDVAAALEASAFACGYHHFLKNGEQEGRRGVPPGPCCVIDGCRTPIDGRPSTIALASAIQRARPAWRVLLMTGWKLPAGSGLHPWVEWVRAPGVLSEASERVLAERPSYVVRLGAEGIVPPDGVGVIELNDRADASRQPVAPSGDPVLALNPGRALDPMELALTAERVAVAAEMAAWFARLRARSRLVGDESNGIVGAGMSILVPASDAARVVTVAVDLPTASGLAREVLVLEANGTSQKVDVSVGHPVRAVLRIGTGPTRITLRPSKSGARALSRIVLARIESAPVDLVVAPLDTDTPHDALAIIDLNSDLAQAKRALGRFMTRADILVSARPAYEFGLPALPTLAPVAVPRCLVVSTFDAERSWTGRDTLDVAAWREYLELRGFRVDFLELPLGTTSDAGRMRKQDLFDHRFVLLTSPRAPALLTDGLERSRHVVRLYQGAAAGGRAVAPRERPDDLACALAADRVVVAGPGDAAYYRAGGVAPGRIDYVPRFLPAIYRRLPRPYPSRPRQLVLHIDTVAVLENRIRRHGLAKGAIPTLLRDGWTVVISASPRLRSHIEADLGLDEPHPSLGWCDPAVDLPRILHSTRLVLAPAIALSDIGGLTTAARILGFRVLVDNPTGPSASGHVAALPRSISKAGALDRLDRDPGGVDMEAARAEAFRSLDRVLGFRDAGWQEGRHDRSADI